MISRATTMHILRRAALKTSIAASLCAIAAACLPCAIADAGQIRLHFEGTITQIDVVGDPGFSLPDSIEVANGAILDLAFTPAPFPAASKSVGSFSSPGGTLLLTPSTFELALGGELLVDAKAGILFEHDPLTPSTGSAGGAILAGEHINIRALGAVPDEAGYSWTTAGGLSNVGSLLDGGEDLGDPDVWNALPRRNLSITFRDGGLGAITVTTDLGAATLVPEPSGAILGLACLILGAGRRSPLRPRPQCGPGAAVGSFCWATSANSTR